jgi:hypothetical protein
MPTGTDPIVKTHPEGTSFSGRTGRAWQAPSRLGRRRDHPRIAVITSVIGWLVAIALQPRATRRQSGATPAR